MHETKKRSISIVLRGILVNAEFSRITLTFILVYTSRLHQYVYGNKQFVISRRARLLNGH